MHRLLHAGAVLCTVVGALILYAAAVGALCGFVLRRIKEGRPRPDARVTVQRKERRAQRWSDLSGWQNRDRAWAVVVVLLGSPSIAERTEPYVNLAERQVDWVGLRLEAAHWPRADRVLVDVAHDLTAGFGPGDAAEFYPAERIALADLVIDLDQPRTDLVQAAVNLRRGACSYREARRLAERTV